MALQSVWYFTDLHEEIVDIIEKDISIKFDNQMADSKLHGFLWHYIMRANRENFLYDLKCIDGESMQYTRYEEGQFYGWHNDSGLATHYKPVSVGNRMNGEDVAVDYMNENCEMVRKLSFALQLSSPDDYEGGNVQLLDETGKSYITPRKRGTIVLFDSRTQHRVLKVKKGVRKSIVGWVVGPRWK